MKLLTVVTLLIISAVSSAKDISLHDPSKNRKQEVYDGAIGTCRNISSGPVTDPGWATYDLAPSGFASQLLQEKFKRPMSKEDIINAKVTLVNAPKHGVVVEGDDRKSYKPDYHPNPNFTGKDHATFMVEIAGYKIRVEYYLRVGMDACPDDLASWKISSIFTPEIGILALQK